VTVVTPQGDVDHWKLVHDRATYLNDTWGTSCVWRYPARSWGIVRQVQLNFVPEARVGDFVMVHVGFAISVVDAAEAESTYRILEDMGVLEAELPPARRGSEVH
jgi:hydrogenase assembly chaperone HypC/HupF